VQPSSGVGALPAARPVTRAGRWLILLYDVSGFEDGDAGFPDLLLYGDGTALVGVRGTRGPPEKARLVKSTPDDAATLLNDLEKVGLFELKRPVVAANAANVFDFPGTYVQARLGNRTVAVYSYGPAVDADSKTVAKASTLIREFIGSLPGGVAYAPKGYQLQIIPAGDIENPPPGVADARDWVLSSVPLLPLVRGNRSSLAVPAVSRPSLARMGPAYTWILVASRPYYYRIQWRPIYPHE
jgi:hypothetical protein